MKNKTSLRNRSHLYFIWGVAGIITIFVSQLMNLFNLLSTLLLPILYLKDLYDEIMYRKHSREPKWWNLFEHSTTAISLCLTNIYIGINNLNIYYITLGLLYMIDFLWDIYQDYRSKNL
ncbi:MAG: hypothetical protein J7K23_09970 [Thermoproteales archaeon]|nr:hypothetical protein [Thermoproteales archaeon]